jgi:glutamine amidotransferase
MKQVAVIDYGMGNLGSVRRSLEECGARVDVIRDPARLAAAGRLVLPGVGAFADGMKRLNEGGWVQEIRRKVQGGTPLLGICLGMQLLADQGEEGGLTPGLGFVAGKTIRLVADAPQTRIPHVGWNEVNAARPSGLFDGIRSGTDFYFVHSYHFVPDSRESVLATTPFCGGFVSAVAKGSVAGVQFHPEKSSKAGLQLLKNFLKPGFAESAGC